MSKKSKIISLITVSLCVLLLVGSIVCTALMFTGDIVVNNKQDIVANAQVINGVDYPYINLNNLNLVASYTGVSGGYITTPDGYIYDSFYLAYFDELIIEPLGSYYLVFDSTFYAKGSFVATDNFASIGDFDVIAVFSLYDTNDELSNHAMLCLLVFNSVDLEYYLLVDDTLNEIPVTATDIYIYSFPSSDTSNSTIDNIGSIIASGMTFGLDGITSSVSTAFDSVFLDNDGNLSNYSIFVFWALGVSVALGFFKYILDWILSLGSRK